MDPILAGFIGYLLVVVVVGFITVRITKTLADFLLGGRRLGAWVVAFSERASGESAWLLIGLPGLALASGFSAIWSAIGCAVGIFASWTLVARRLRVQTEKLGALTLPDYFEARFKDTSHLLRIVSMAVIVFFFTFYVSAQFLAAGKVLHATFGLEPIHGMLIGAVIIIFYTIMGGFFAVAWTDLVQGILMAGAMILLPLAAWIAARRDRGSAERIGDDRPQPPPGDGRADGTTAHHGAHHRQSRHRTRLRRPAASAHAVHGHPRRASELRKGTMIAMSWVIIAFWGAVLVGIAGPRALRRGRPGGRRARDAADRDSLPPGGHRGHRHLGGHRGDDVDRRLAAARRHVRALGGHLPSAHEQGGVRSGGCVAISRIGTVLIGVIAFVLALGVEEQRLLVRALRVGGPGRGVRPRHGALPLVEAHDEVGRVLRAWSSGSVTAVVWHNVPVLKDFVYELVPAFIFALVAVVVVSLLTEAAGSSGHRRSDTEVAR